MSDCKKCPFTDEYCASGDCKRNADVSKTLTEKWKKRKLSKGDYYVLHISWCEFIDKLYYDGGMFFSGDVPVESKEIKEVLAPVPSYKEWKETYNCMFENEVLRLKNAQLKELLKECVEVLNDAQRNYGYDDSILDICSPVITKIDEVLNEKVI